MAKYVPNFKFIPAREIDENHAISKKNFFSLGSVPEIENFSLLCEKAQALYEYRKKNFLDCILFESAIYAKLDEERLKEGRLVWDCKIPLIICNESLAIRKRLRG